MKHVGFTGTQVEMTGEQALSVRELLRSFYEPGAHFHHGGCLGADVQAAEMARTLGYWTVRHPGDNPAFLDDDYREVLENLVRNRVIVDESVVDESEVLIAAPGEGKEKLRSGTWATIRYARKVRRDHYIVDPDGTIR